MNLNMTYTERFPYYFSQHLIGNRKNQRSPFKYLLVIALLLLISAVGFRLHNAQAHPVSMVDDLALKEKLQIYQIIHPHVTGLPPKMERDLAEFIYDKSREYNYDPLFILAIIKVESVFYNYSLSSKEAVGLMQIRPFVARAIARELNIEWKGHETLYDPFANVSMGLHYLFKLDKRFGSDVPAMLTAYNWGPTYVSKRLRAGESLPLAYSKKVLAIYNNLKKQAPDVS